MSESRAPGGEHDLLAASRAVRVISPAPRDAWADVVDTDPGATAFQTPEWMNALDSAGGWTDATRLYELPGDRRAILLLAARSGPLRNRSRASWPHGWGTGGLIASGGAQPADVAVAIEDLRRDRFTTTAIRPNFSSAPAWAALEPPAVKVPRSVHVAELLGTIDDYKAKALSKSMRKNLKHALNVADRNGLVVTSGHSESLVDHFYDIYLDWLSRRAAEHRFLRPAVQWHGQRAEPRARFSSVARSLGERCEIFVASLDGRPIAANIVLFHRTVAIGWRAYARPATPRALRINDLLVFRVIERAYERGCRFIEMGESGGRAELAARKVRFGGRPVLFDEYIFEPGVLSAARETSASARRRLESRISRGRSGHGGTP